MIGFKTIRQGERAAIWGWHGQVKVVDGPVRIFLLGETAEFLTRYAALPSQYLVIQYKDGRTEHVPGPAEMWFDPVAHESILIQDSIPVGSNEAVVVYRHAEERVDRRVVRGPALYVPASKEWLHSFAWHGADPKNPRRKISRALQFTKLWVIPDQTYFDVEEVRTADDALLLVKLMIFFELVDIERMLDQTHDPIADFINAVTADVIDFAAGLSFEAFKENTNRLNNLETYRQLVQRAERIGYRINKVVYRGYHASDKLQAMHDNAIEARTRLRLEAETENQAQVLADLKLEREAERAVKRQAMDEAEIHHQNRLERLTHEEAMRKKLVERETKREARRLWNEMELANLQATNREQAAFLQALQGLQVDVTRYLVAKYQNPDKLIRIDGKESPQLHLHEN